MFGVDTTGSGLDTVAHINKALEVADSDQATALSAQLAYIPTIRWGMKADRARPHPRETPSRSMVSATESNWLAMSMSCRRTASFSVAAAPRTHAASRR